jgi:hypothetical protein
MKFTKSHSTANFEVLAGGEISPTGYSLFYNTLLSPSGEERGMPVRLSRKRMRTGSPKSTAIQLTLQLELPDF